MSEAIHAVVVSGIDLPDFLSMLPPLEEAGASASSPWPDDEEVAMAIAERDGFVFGFGGLLELMGEGLAQEASRQGTALYLCEDPEAERFCCAKFASKRPAGRVEVIDGDIVDDSMGMFAARNKGGDKRYGRIDAHEMLLSFTGGKLAPLEWTHYEISERLNP